MGRPENNRRRNLTALVIVIAVLAVFWPVLACRFVTWDDDINVYENLYLNPPTWNGVGHFWERPYEGLYAPLTYTVWAGMALLAYEPARDGMKATMDPSVFHAGNLVLHVLNALLVFALLRMLLNRMGRNPGADIGAGFGALFFALHPLQVEPVAWVTGLKDLLSGTLGLAAVWLYLRHSMLADKPQGRRGAMTSYALGLAALILALLAKPTAAVVPIIAFVLDTWVSGRTVGRRIVRLVPWLIVSGGAMGFAKFIQSGEHVRFIAPIWSRPFIAGDALAFYLGRIARPISLAADYGRSPEFALMQWWIYVTWLIPAILAFLIVRRRSRGPWLVSAGVFVAGLLPVLGFVPFVFQSYSTVADRYLYLSMLGPALALGWIMAARQRMVLRVACVLALAALALMSNVQTRHWKDTTSLFEHTLTVNPRSSVAYYNMGLESAGEDRLDEAIERFRKALVINPDYAKAHNNLGVALAGRGDVAEAIDHLAEAVNIKRDYAVAHYNLGIILLSQNDPEGAFEHLSETVRIYPDHLEAQLSLGKLLARMGKPDEAAVHLRKVIRIDPKHAEGHLCLGMVAGQMRRLDEAITHLQRAAQLKPDYVEAHNNLAVTLFLSGRYAEARNEAELCMKYGGKLNPQFLEALSEKLGQPAGGENE